MASRRKATAEPDAAAVTAAEEIRARQTTRQRRRAEVEGFGCPRTDWPHHVQVNIPAIRGAEVQVIEDFGVGGHASGRHDQLVRCVLPRGRWNAMADTVRRAFNERLRTLGLPVGAWKPGTTRVERMLGQELILLAMLCAAADEADVPAVIGNWTSLRPEERWWFAGWLTAHESPRTLRGAALMFSGGPAEVQAALPPLPKPLGTLPLFGGLPAGKH